MLVGVPGAGKSTVGPILAEHLSWKFVDFDPLIEAEAGCTIREIFAEKGEDEFRRLESELTARLASESKLVLAPGGGWVLRNRLDGALMVWLQADPEAAVKRMGDAASARPLLSKDPVEGMKRLLLDRESFYRRAHIHVDTNGRTAHEVALAVAVAAERYGNQKER